MATRTRAIRKIIQIDEEKCNGCGHCAAVCAEGAIEIRGSKARLVSDRYCDGLAACIGECPKGALSIIERPADDFDEKAVEHRLLELKEQEEKKLPCGCPSTSVSQFECACESNKRNPQPSLLRHWPVQITLVPPGAPFLKNADVLLVADCVPFAYGGFHQDFLKNHAVIVACPKLDNFEAHLAKLTAVLSQSEIKSLNVVRMEVPCCSGLTFMAKKAIAASGKEVPFKETVIGIHGEVKE